MDNHDCTSEEENTSPKGHEGSSSNLLPDVDPKSFPTWRKWMMLIIVGQCSFCVTFTSSIYTSIYDQILKDFHCSQEVAILGLSMFVLGLAFGPMIAAPLSEFYGRRPIYIVSLSAFLIWQIPSAAAQNIQTMIVGRFLAGFSGSAFLSVSGGTVVDLWNREDLQLPMVIFSSVQFLGPVLGPVVGGFISSFTSWRWCFYVVIIWTASLLLSIIFFVPETYSKVLLQRFAQKMGHDNEKGQKGHVVAQSVSVRQAIIRSCYRPFQLLALEPMVLCLCLYSALLLAILYLFFGAFFIVFTETYGFNLWQGGLTFLGIGCGMAIGGFSNSLWHKNYHRLLKKADGRAEPELRLPPAMLGAVLVPTGLFFFAWTAYPSIHWIVPIFGSALYGGGIFLAFTGIFTFLTDAYTTYAASALAANQFMRCCFAAGFPLFGDQMYRRLGSHWATSLLAFLTIAALPFPFLFYKYGKTIRSRSTFAR